MNKNRWDRLLAALGIEAELHTYQQLINAYSEKHRAYHSISHVNSCIDALDSCELTLERVHELEVAFWFHDAIYKVFSKTNEEDSAAWAVRFLEKNGVEQPVVSRVNRYILDTKHNVIANTLEARVVVDIDLAILGSEPSVYDGFEQAIAREYRVVPSLIFRKKRKLVLETFVQRETIYQTEYYRARYEAQARLNLAKAIEQLS